MSEVKQDSVKSIIFEKFSEQYVENIGILLHRMAESFVNNCMTDDRVYFDEEIFKKCLLDMFVDLARLVKFHDIDRVNEIKIAAYAASWCLRRKPFQRKESCGKELLFVNELFALTILMDTAGIYNSKGMIAKADKDIFEKQVRQLFYHLKYRDTDSKTLELYLNGLNTGKIVYRD